MATPIAGGGQTRPPGEGWNMPLLNATSLDDAGYVLTYKVESSVNKVDKAAQTDDPKCVNYRSTRDPFDMREPPSSYLTGTQVGEKGIAVFADGWAKLKLATNNAAITRGKHVRVASSGGGKVDKYTENTIPSSGSVSAAVNARFDEIARIVGIAEETVSSGTSSAPAKDKILVRLTIGLVGKD